jgi:predicted DNA-binding transcriptional regulator YafY
MPEDKTDNRQVFYNIDIIDEAIEKGKKISFKYLDYGADKKQHVKCRRDGSERVYIINPYQMAAKDGRYYLICNYDKYNDISNYRVDRITDIEMLDEKVKPFEELEGANGRKFNLSDYMKQHIYMYASDNVRAKFRINKSLISDVIDMFGMDIRFYDEKEETVCVSANVNEQAMVQYARNYVPDIVVLEPAELKGKVKEALYRGIAAYEE